MPTSPPLEKTGAGPTPAARDKTDARNPVRSRTDSPDDSSLGQRAQAAAEKLRGKTTDPLQATIEKAAAKAGMSVEEFATLPTREQNAYLIETKADAQHPENAAPTKWVPPGTIERSPFNREIFNADALAELTENVRQHGVLQPLLVRPVKYELVPPGVHLGWRITCNRIDVAEFKKSHEAAARRRFDELKHITLQLVAGERRWRASTAAKLKLVPVIIRQLTDEEAIEFQAIENLQREDLNPIHEAEKYQQLLDIYHARKLSPADAINLLVQKVGKGKSTVYERLRLLKLPDSAKNATVAGTLPPSHAGLLSKLEKYPDSLGQVTKKIMHPDRWNAENGVMSFRAAKELVDQELAEREAESKWNAAAEAARAKGIAILLEAERKKLLPHGYLRHDCDWVTGDDYCYGLVGGAKSYKALMGKHAPAPILTHDNQWKVLELYPKAAAIEAIKKSGHKFAASTNGSGAQNSWQKEQAAKRRRIDRKNRVHREAIARLVAACEKPTSVAKFPWLLFIKRLLDPGFRANSQLIASRRELGKGDYDKLVLTRAGKMTQREIAGLLIEIAACEDGWEDWNKRWSPEFLELCKHFGIDLKRIEAQFGDPAEQKTKSKAAKQMSGPAKKKSRGLTPEARKKLNDAMKARWAARRKAAKS